LLCAHATKYVTYKTLASSNESSRSLRAWHVVPILEGFHISPGNASIWGPIFSSALHNYSLGQPYLPDFIKIGRAVSSPYRVEKIVDRLINIYTLGQKNRLRAIYTVSQKTSPMFLAITRECIVGFS